MLLASATDDGELYAVASMGDYLVDGVYVGVYESIYTELAEGKLYYPVERGNGQTKGDGYHMLSQVAYWSSSDEPHEESSEVYTTPNGLTVTIVKSACSTPGKERVAYGGYCLIDGVPLCLNVSGTGTNDDRPMTTPEHAMEVLKMVLDGFILD